MGLVESREAGMLATVSEIQYDKRHLIHVFLKRVEVFDELNCISLRYITKAY